MNYKRNMIASYVSQIYVVMAGVVVLPMYIKYMGSEAYGLVGFFTMLQAWFSLLDIGLTPTIARETARYRTGTMTDLAYKQLFRALSLIFFVVAVFFGGGLWLLAQAISSNWLKVTSIPMSEVVLAVQIMAVSIALRWFGGLYRSVITGYESLTWLAVFNFSIATLRFGAVFFSMLLYGFTPYVFFSHQLVVALIELLGLFLMSNNLLSSCCDHKQVIGWSIKPVKSILSFALSISVTAFIWVLITQGDKLILSGILPLTDYGYFTLAVLVASGVTIITSPISLVIMPRMSGLQAEGRDNELVDVYRKATKLVSIISGTAATVMFFCAEPLVYAWTGDRALTEQVAPILRLYAVGNGILAVSAMPYYLQYAKGFLRYHIIGNLIFAVVMIPLIVIAASYYGGVGAGAVWVILNLTYLFLWVPYVHKKIKLNHFDWIIYDVSVIVVPGIILSAVMSTVPYMYSNRLSATIYVVCFSTLVMLCSLICSGAGRYYYFKLRRLE